MKKKLSYGLQEKDIIEMQVWSTLHKIFFQQCKSSSTISLNAHYLVLFQSQEIRCKLKYWPINFKLPI